MKIFLIAVALAAVFGAQANDTSSYPSEGVLRHTVVVEIVGGTAAEQPEGTGERTTGQRSAPPRAEAGRITEEGRAGGNPVPESFGNASVSRPAAGPVLSKTIKLRARNGFLASQILKTFLDERGFVLQWKARYDCRLKNGVTFTDSDMPRVLSKFLQMFSLSAKIFKQNKVVSVFPSGGSSKICIPAEGRAVLAAGEKQ